MTSLTFLKLWSTALGVMFLIDMAWLGAVAKNFYRTQLGHLMRPDVLWVPAVLFYLIYVAALVVIVIWPAIERQSLTRAIAFGALFGLAAYAAYDLTSLALMKDFPVAVAVVDLAWGAVLTGGVAGATYLMASRMGVGVS